MTLGPAARTHLPTEFGTFTLHGWRETANGREHAALTVGPVDDGLPVLTRLHSECLTGDVFSSLRCDCGSQLSMAMKRLATEGRGVVLYLRQEGRGIGLVNKIRAYALQDAGADTVDANRLLALPDDARDYGVAAAMLQDLGVRSVLLMTNNPSKIQALEHLGIRVDRRVPLLAPRGPHNADYLAAKCQRMGHWLERPSTTT